MNRHLESSKEYPQSPWRYEPEGEFFDELISADGSVRRHWRPLSDALAHMGAAGLAARFQEGRRLIRDNGITYNVYGDPQSTDRPWPLDPVPFLIDQDEWSRIEAAIAQRASLLNRMLADLYGPRRLLRDRLLPPELVFPNPAYLRPLRGVTVPHETYLHVYAADIARSPDGQWWVIADRTQAPSGAGYALENRLVSLRMLPDVFRAGNVRRLAAFFDRYRETLRGLAPARRENPRVVLLTPGPYNETYFEHAFLARYLGYTLVEGGDLTVRNNVVYLKTLGGLLPVDVIVRRQDDSYCDPLELRGDSMLGVAGLVQAVRSGNVAVANALGSGVLESAAPSAFLPGLCRRLLGEELKMPTVATWWCGQEGPRAYVEEHLQSLVIKPTFPEAGVQPIFGARLSAVERQDLLRKLRAAPSSYVAQEQVALSTVPVWEEQRLRPRHVVLRIYAVAAGDSYMVMPGGLTRVTASLESLVVSVQHGGGSKDTWVLADTPTAAFSLLRQASGPLEVSRATFDLPSRVADNLFWLGRYVERFEGIVRALRALLPRTQHDADPSSAAGLEAGHRVLAALGYLGGHPAPGEHRAAYVEREALAMIYARGPRSAVAWPAGEIRRIAWLLRDRISPDSWRVLQQFDQQFSAPPPAAPLRLGAAQDLLDRAVISLAAFSGLAMESMTRGHGWRFLDLGRRLERASQMVALLEHGLGFATHADAGRLEALLEIADSSLTYRSRYLNLMQTDLVVDLLLLDEGNPRSVAFQLARVRDHVDQLPESRTISGAPPEVRLALSLLTSVQLAQAGDLVNPENDGRAEGLEMLLRRLAGELRQLSEVLTRVYFNHAIPSRQLSQR